MKTALLTLSLLLTGCGATTGPTKLRIANIGTGLQTLHMPLALAQSLGFFREEGLDVTLENLSSNAKTLQAFIGGSVDVAGIHQMQTIQMAAEGQHIRTFFVMMERSSTVLLVAPNANEKIRRAEDLRGAVVGVPSPGSPTHVNINFFLQNHGIQPSEIKPVAIGVAAAAVAAVESGRLDAAAVSNGDHFRLLRRNPAIRILLDTSTTEGMRQAYGTSVLPNGVVAAKPEWLDANPDTARRITRALARANQWITSHTPQEIRDKLPEGLRSPDVAADLEILQWSLPSFTKGGEMPAGGPEALKKMLDTTSETVRNAKIDLPATWTNDFLPDTK